MGSDPAPADETFARSTTFARSSSDGGNQGAGAGVSIRSRYNRPMPSRPELELFREVFGRFVTGVAVITSAGPGGIGGMTANALCSLSLDPLLALVCFENEARTLPIVRDAGRFGVNVLNEHQADVAEVFASKLPEEEKLQVVDHRVVGGVPIIEGAIAWATCDLRELLAGGDHTIAIGEVRELGLGDGEPLLWYGGRYHAFSRGLSSA
jgi:flavin reductase (DIM6/NTAB) family NADH-FMN oxidoreductase RutF